MGAMLQEIVGSRLSDIYGHYFEFKGAETPEEVAEAFRIRYQVYCVENVFEDPASFPDGQERDECDERAMHALLYYKLTGEAVGTVRLVLPDANRLQSSFPLQAACTDAVVRDPASFPVERMAEVSRFCVAKSFRRRSHDTQYPANHVPMSTGDDLRRVLPNMMLGLIESLVRMSSQAGIQYWCAMMEPSLLRLLRGLGIHFLPLGEVVDHHGRRQPCYNHLPSLLERTKRERRDIWDLITADGRHLRGLQ